MFQIYCLDSKEFLKNEEGEFYSFSDGGEAALFCSALTAQNKKCQPRSVKINLNWKDIQEEKFKSGEYTIPEFLGLYMNRDHYSHVSKSNPEKLSYIKDEINGMNGNRTLISVRGYLEKFTNLDKIKIDDLCMKFNLFVIEDDGLKFATDPEEITTIYTIYETGFDSLCSSCMRGSFSYLPSHPSVVYGGGDLALAYILGKTGKTRARTVVFPEKRIYGRVYGSSEIHDKLRRRQFQKSVYHSEPGDYENKLSLAGARLKRIPIPDYDKIYLMPFIDEPHLNIVETKEGEWILKRSMANQSNIYNTSGTTSPNFHAPVHCAVCSRYRNPQNCKVVFSAIYTNNYWCEECSKETFKCDETGYYWDNKVKKYEMANGKIWSDHAFIKSGGICQFTKKKYHIRDLIYVHTPSGRREWAKETFTKNGWKSSFDRCYSNEIEKFIYVDSYLKEMVCVKEDLSSRTTVLYENKHYDISIFSKTVIAEEEYVAKIPTSSHDIYSYLFSGGRMFAATQDPTTSTIQPFYINEPGTGLQSRSYNTIGLYGQTT